MLDQDLARARPSGATLVITTQDRTGVLDRLLGSIDRRLFQEILVVDSSPVESAESIAGRHDVSYVLETQRGASRARNRGALEAKTEFIVFLEDDAVPRSGWAERILAEFGDPRVGVVIGRVVLPESVNDPSLVELNRQAGYLQQGDERLVITRESPNWFTTVNFGGVSLGGLMAVRRCIWQDWPGFDERIGAGTALNGGDEPRAFAELIARGWSLVYSPEAVVEHPAEPRSTEQMHKLVRSRVTAATAYLLLLWREEPQHRRELLAYVLRKLRYGTREYQAKLGLRSSLFYRLGALPAYRQVRKQVRVGSV